MKPTEKPAVMSIPELRDTLKECTFSYGVKGGQLNIALAKKPGEPHRQYQARTEAFAEALCHHAELDGRSMFTSRGRAVLRNPGKNMRFILDAADLKADALNFDRSTIDETPALGAARVAKSFADETAERAGGMVARLGGRGKTHVARVMFDKVREADNPTSGRGM